MILLILKVLRINVTTHHAADTRFPPARESRIGICQDIVFAGAKYISAIPAQAGILYPAVIGDTRLRDRAEEQEETP